MSELLPRDLFDQLYWRSGRLIPLEVVEPLRATFTDEYEIRVRAQKDGAKGYGIAFVPVKAVLLSRRHFDLMVQTCLRDAAWRALDGWLIDHETQQGWPPRECMHNSVEGAEVAA